MSEVDADTTKTRDQPVSFSGAATTLVIDSALSEWVYHRAGIDQGLALTDIDRGASIARFDEEALNASVPPGTGYLNVSGQDGTVSHFVIWHGGCWRKPLNDEYSTTLD